LEGEIMTRDSIYLTLIAVAAAGAYLASMPPPAEWTWAQWCQSVAAAAIWVAAKLSTSPLPGEDKKESVK
jgi:hypothetical protein